MIMEGEINNFTVLWLTVLASLCYCHAIAKLIPKGFLRLLTILPIIGLFLYLPLSLHTIHLGSTTSFFIAWLANFRLLLFAFGKGPLSSNPPISLSLFIPLAYLPIEIQDNPSPPNLEKPLSAQTKTDPSHQTNNTGHKSPPNYAPKVVLLSIVVHAYRYRDHVHPRFTMLLYCLHIYLALELMLALIGALVGAMFRVALKPQFDQPYLSTSLQNFWGRRWNLMVSSVLRQTVYNPIKSISCRLIGRKWCSIPGVLATFTVSGLMHELIFYYAGRVKPTWEMTSVFILQGVCVAAEIVIKKTVNGRFRLPPAVSVPLVMAFLVVTGVWLFIPPILRCGLDVRARQENVAILEYLRNMGRSINFGG